MCVRSHDLIHTVVWIFISSIIIVNLTFFFLLFSSFRPYVWVQTCPAMSPNWLRTPLNAACLIVHACASERNQMTAWEKSDDPYRLHNVLFFEQPTSGQWVKTDGPGNKKVMRVEQKPVDMLMELIKRYTNEGDMVVDPFCGTGSTAVAAMMLGRRFIGGDVSNLFLLSNIFSSSKALTSHT
jgi:hypothetical protein